MTHTGPGGATGTTQGTYAQTQRFTPTVWEGIVAVPSAGFAGSFAATYTANGSVLTFTKTCGNLNATGSTYSVVSATELHLQNGGNSVQVLQLQ